MPELEFEKLAACPVCGGTDIPTILFVIERLTHEPMSYSNCQDCGQFFLNPHMTDEQTAKYYAGVYRERLWGPTGTNDVDVHNQRVRASLQAQILTLWGLKPKTVLDVGCGAGFALWEWAQRGAEVTGIEPDERCHRREPEKRYRVYKDLAELEPQSFDLICMSHVLEHLNHPKEYLQNLTENYTHENTFLMIEVPNCECCLPAFQISHPLAFTRYSLEKLLEKVGYKPVHMLYHGLSNTVVHRYLLELFQPGQDKKKEVVIHATKKG